MILGGEVDCLKPKPKKNPYDSTSLQEKETMQRERGEMVELKTSMTIKNQRDEERFEIKMLRFYTQSFLLGIPVSIGKLPIRLSREDLQDSLSSQSLEDSHDLASDRLAFLSLLHPTDQINLVNSTSLLDSEITREGFNPSKSSRLWKCRGSSEEK